MLPKQVGYARNLGKYESGIGNDITFPLQFSVLERDSTREDNHRLRFIGERRTVAYNAYPAKSLSHTSAGFLDPSNPNQLQLDHAANRSRLHLAYITLPGGVTLSLVSDW